MTKLIVLLLVGLLAYLIIRNYRARRGREGRQDRGRVDENMVRCEECGLHHPRSESRLSAGKFYCSPEHEQRARHRN